MEAALDRFGRVVIPKPMRQRLGLNAGDRLRIECSGDTISLQLAPADQHFVREQGLTLMRTGKPIPRGWSESVLDQIRVERGQS